MQIRIALLVLSGSAVMFAQNALVSDTKLLHDLIKGNVVKSAEKMPEDKFAFKPTPDVRTYGQVLGHIADANYMFCSAVKTEKNPVTGIEKGKTAKADLVKAVQESFAYCDTAYAGLTDAQASEETKFFGRERSKLGILNFNIAHNFEHYGNLVTYMRENGLVPPSSEGR